LRRTFCFVGLNAKILTVPLAAFFVGLLLPGAVGYWLLQRQAESATRDKAQAILQTLMAPPSATGEARTQSGKSCPAEIANFPARQGMRASGGDGKTAPFRFRQVALNPANPAHRADPYEACLITTFASHPETRQIEDTVQGKQGSFQVLAVPVIVSQDRCLRCHGTPGAAPAWRAHSSGKTAGFGWKKGQVVGASILYVPNDLPRAGARQAFFTILKLVGLVSLLATGLLLWRTQTLITRPVRNLLTTSEAIRRGDWKARFSAYWPDELAELATSFQNTTLWLRGQVAKEEKLRALFQQFVPASVAARALGTDADQFLTGTRHPVTVLVLNIRNFKLLMEHLPPEQTVSTLNEFFCAVNQVIVANKGLVSKYLGDSVVAIFGMPMGNGDHALQAVRAAMGIPSALQNLYVRLSESYGWELGVGIGISTGEPIVGYFGSSAHMEYTVLGEVAVEAHRLEEATKSVPEEDTILISEATYRCVMSDVHVYDLGERAGAGGKPIHAYVVQGFRSEARSALAA